MIDLRSDTATRPTPEMLAAMTAAELGDEQLREDPTVNELQRRAAELLGQEAALFLPTATMANQIALKILSRPGCLLIAQERTHIMIFEAGGPAIHSGLVMVGLQSENGRITPEQLRDVTSASEDVEPASVVVFENTHRSAGGRVWPLDELAASAAAARELGIAVHLDGARIMNAAAASGIPAADYGRLADSVTICFSKGLGCPLGAVLASSEERIERAWREKFLFGGAMRQAGVVAAAALYALDHNIERLAEDHARARRLAEGLAEAGLPVDPATAETNFVGIDVGPLGMDVPEARARIREQGVLVSVMRPGVLRAATYLGIEDEHVDRAREAIPRALGALVSA
ncbi:MAG: aminotransferase class I/II-fold pyridoxal phosphate-dependent enzyme [Actinobacteria bacterium]|nr:aminotransferase class I/II-fold pyridoxal phosphate-dependent enzyme [Actinomycetota bacterium]